LLSVALAPAFAQAPPAGGGGVPNVSNLTPFGPEANYMSLAGYLRYVSYDQTGQWLTRQEADRMVAQQKGGG
jgi:hypothetical protein